MSQAAAVARNAALLITMNTAQKILAFVAFTIVARIVGKEITGEYFFIISITSIFVAFTDLGLTSVIIRAAAQDERQGTRLYTIALRLKALLIPIAIICACFYGYWHGIRDVSWYGLWLACLVMSADSLSMLAYGFLRGRQNLRYEAVGVFIGQLLSAVMSIAAASMGYGATGLIFALLVASSWNLLWSVWQVHRIKELITDKQSGSEYRELIVAALPFGLAALFVKIYSYIDSQIIHHYHGEAVLGEYAVAYKLTYALQFLPMAFVAALYPSMSHSAKHDTSSLRQLFLGSLRLMMFFGIGMALSLSLLARYVLPVLYGWEYDASIPILEILALVLIPIFLDFPVGSLLNATHRAGKKTFAMGIAMIMNAAGNFYLIPKIGAIGAAWSALACFIVMYILGMWFVRQETDWKAWSSLHARGLAMGMAIFLTFSTIIDGTSINLAILLQGISVIGWAFVFRLVQWQDIRRILRWLTGKVQGVHQ